MRGYSCVIIRFRWGYLYFRLVKSLKKDECITPVKKREIYCREHCSSRVSVAIVSKHSLSSTPTFVRNIVDLKTEEDRSRNVLIMYITTAKMKDHFLLSGNEFNQLLEDTGV